MSGSRLDSLEKSFRSLPIIKKELERLRKGLPSSLCYHSALHTEDVLHECLLFGIHDNLTERELHLLAIAATFHDSGFLVKPFRNERIGADFAAMAMEDCGKYTKDEIYLVSQMIRDTEIIWHDIGPKFLINADLSKYLLDADLSNFGREDFFEKSKLIATETNQTISQLRPMLVQFMNNHSWHTPAAKVLRQEQKLKNMKILEAEMGR